MNFIDDTRLSQCGCKFAPAEESDLAAFRALQTVNKAIGAAPHQINAFRRRLHRPSEQIRLSLCGHGTYPRQTSMRTHRSLGPSVRNRRPARARY